MSKVKHTAFLQFLKTRRHKPTPQSKVQSVTLEEKVARLEEYDLTQPDFEGDLLIAKALRRLTKPHHHPILLEIIARSDLNHPCDRYGRKPFDLAQRTYLDSGLLEEMKSILLQLAQGTDFKGFDSSYLVQFFRFQEYHELLEYLMTQITGPIKPGVGKYYSYPLVTLVSGFIPAELIPLALDFLDRGDLTQRDYHGSVLSQSLKFQTQPHTLPLLFRILEANHPKVHTDRRSPLIYACQHQHHPEMIPFLEELLQRSDPNYQGPSKMTALMELLRRVSRYPEMLPFLLSLIRASDLKLMDHKKETPLIYAIRYCRHPALKPAMRLLIQGDEMIQGCEIKSPEGPRPLPLALKLWGPTELRVLIPLLIELTPLSHLLELELNHALPHLHHLNQQMRAVLPAFYEMFSFWGVYDSVEEWRSRMADTRFLKLMKMDVTTENDPEAWKLELEPEVEEEEMGEEVKEAEGAVKDDETEPEMSSSLEELPAPTDPGFKVVFLREKQAYLDFRHRFTRLLTWAHQWKGKMAVEFWPWLMGHLQMEHPDPIRGFVRGMDQLGWAPGFWESEKLAQSRPEFEGKLEEGSEEAFMIELGKQASALIGK